jgi:hypothetical protein
MIHLTTAEAFAAAQERGLSVTINTVRNIAREHGLTVRMGRRVFIKAEPWLQLIDKGEPDCEPPHRIRQNQPDA